jgi:hypothetical protein
VLFSKLILKSRKQAEHIAHLIINPNNKARKKVTPIFLKCTLLKK